MFIVAVIIFTIQIILIKRLIENNSNNIEMTIKHKGKDVELTDEEQRKIWEIITKSINNNQ